MSGRVQKKPVQKISSKIVADDFSAAFLLCIQPETLKQFDPETLKQIVVRHRTMSQSRKRGNTVLEITNPSEREVGKASHTTIDIVGDDKAFIIDSVIAHMSRTSYPIEKILHSLVYVGTSKGGNVGAYLAKKTENYLGQSHIYIECARRLTKEQIAELKHALQVVFEDTTLSNRDWLSIKEGVQKLRDNLLPSATSSKKEFADYQDFIDYIHNDNFTLLGMSDYTISAGKDGLLKPVAASGLGLLSATRSEDFLTDSDKKHILKNTVLASQAQILVTKLMRKSTVHRSVPVDAIVVKRVDAKKQTVGYTLIIGLFTSVTYSRSLGTVPFLRMKAENVMQAAGYDGLEHGGRAMRHILEKYPRDELFQINHDQLYKTCVSIMLLQEQPRIALYIRPDIFGRTVTCLVYIPRDIFDSRLRIRFSGILASELNANLIDFQSAVDDSPMVRISFVLAWNDGATQKFNHATIEAALQEAGTSWAVRLNKVFLIYGYDEDAAAELTLRYGRAFADSYQERYQVRQSIHDIQKIEQVVVTGTADVDFYKPYNADSQEVSLKIFSPINPIHLSNVLPILENMGLSIIAEYPFEVKPRDVGHSVWIQDFQAGIAASAAAQQTISFDKAKIAAISAEFESCLKGVWEKQIENDSLNKLIILAGMPWRDVVILRSYVRYLRQTKIPFSLPYMEKALTDHPEIALLLTQYFHVVFNPALQGKKGISADSIEKQILENLQKVSLLDQDRVLRAMFALIRVTLRTNFYQTDENGEPKAAVSIKFDSAQIVDIPDPKPYREIFVYSPRVEGVHLRCGPISRGGLRWSDRHEDFRTEVLGLMKAQQVKNSVIVPQGSKGGFVVKLPPVDGGREAYQKEGIACYQIYIRALLDITDNRKGGKVVPPLDVVRLDKDDPYLVVAADKGTATFSDIANAISVERGFWLGDAFASGGSAGYDHKKMGITARGAWESVKRHFRELNHNTQTDVFDVVGVGDMGGDVFGNGMLQSEKIRLVGAFNHVHIFCDPLPDAASSFKERDRLFKAVKGWDHYDVSKLSKGGRIYARSEKYLKLTPEIQQRFEIEKDTVSPSELMVAMLKSRSDLLFFGGIGTYIKATTETDADAGDRSNDAQRINAADVRAKVVGEGANMAITQRGRIEFAQKGGRANTDFIDNSAGVDTSDHEVNIKILMSDIMSDPKQKMNIAGRDKLLATMTDDVARLVLNDNYQQTQAISLLEAQAADLLPEHATFMNSLEKAKLLNRRVEFLPDAEQIEQRLKLRKGLTRPELSLIISYGKITYTDALLQSKLPDDPAMMNWLMAYFPDSLQKKYASAIGKHQLRREIVATAIANAVINRMGPTFVRLAADKTGQDLGSITNAYLVVRDAFGLGDLWKNIEALDAKVPALAQIRAMQKVSKLAERETYWLLNRLGRKANLEKDGAAFSKGISELKLTLEKILPIDMKENFVVRRSVWVENGLPQKLAHEIALLPLLTSGFDIIQIAGALKKDIARVAQVYFACGSVFAFEKSRNKIHNLAQDTPQMAMAVSALIDSFYRIQSSITAQILKDLGKAPVSDKAIAQWIETSCPEAASVIADVATTNQNGGFDFAALVVLEQRLRRLV